MKYASMSPEWLTAQLSKLPADRGLAYNKDGQALLRCHVHAGGQESSPSMTVCVDKVKNGKRLPVGMWGCWSCPAKGFYRDLVAAYPNFLSPAPADGSAASSTEPTAVYVHPGEAEAVADISLLPLWPASEPWRGIRGYVVRRFDGRINFEHGKPKLILPVSVRGETVGTITAMVERRSKKDLAYINSQGAMNAVYGFDAARRWRTKDPLFVCEGPRDCLNLWQHGGRAVALLGTGGARNSSRLQMLFDLDPKLIVLAMDADDAGEAAAASLAAACRDLGVASTRLRMPEGQDPADLTAAKVERLLTALRGKIDRQREAKACHQKKRRLNAS